MWMSQWCRVSPVRLVNRKNKEKKTFQYHVAHAHIKAWNQMQLPIDTAAGQAGNKHSGAVVETRVQSTDKSRQIQVSNYEFEQTRAGYIHVILLLLQKKKQDKQSQLTILEDVHPSREIHGIFRWIIIPYHSNHWRYPRLWLWAIHGHKGWAKMCSISPFGFTFPKCQMSESWVTLDDELTVLHNYIILCSLLIYL